MDINVDRIRELLNKRDDIDLELVALMGGKERRPQKCSVCGSESHNARNCPEKKD